jgi:hypothetical protein
MAHELLSTGNARFLHYALDELHQPRLALSFKPSTTSRTSSISRVVLWAWRALPLLLTLALCLSSLAMQSELQDLRRADSNAAAPLLTEATKPTETVYHTITVTATHYTQPPWASDLPAPPVVEPPAPSAIKAPASPPSPSAEETPSQPSPPPKTMTTIILPTPTATSAAPRYQSTSEDKQERGLMPIYHHLPWTLKFEWDLPTKEDVGQVVVKGLGVVWQAFRKVYHYPLDPP